MKAANFVQWGSLTVSLDRMSFFDKLFIVASFVSTLILSFPHIAAAQAIQKEPLVFQVNEISLDQFSGSGHNYLNDVLARNIPPVVEDPRVVLLRTFLAEKNSPLTSQAETLLQQYHYRLIIGISFAESNFCKVQIRKNNCWGIGGRSPESYSTLADGIVRANNLIQKYQNNGMTNPKLMKNIWVGWPNHNWALAVDEVSTELENMGL